MAELADLSARKAAEELDRRKSVSATGGRWYAATVIKFGSGSREGSDESHRHHFAGFTVALTSAGTACELTSNRPYEWEVVNDQRIKLSSSFSAVVCMQTNGNAVIEN